MMGKNLTLKTTLMDKGNKDLHFEVIVSKKGWNMKTKIAVFDFDGTLTKSKAGGNCWRYVWEKIGKTNRDEELYDQFARGDFDTAEWTARVIAEYRQNGVTKNVVDEIGSKLVLREGVEEVFSFLKANNVKIYIFSGGIKGMIESCLGNNLRFVDGVECEDLIYDENGLVYGTASPEFDTENKYFFIQELVKRLKVAPDEIFFMGNGRNDETAHRSGARTLCVNPDKTNPYDKNCWDFYIENIENMQQILPFIDKSVK